MQSQETSPALDPAAVPGGNGAPVSRLALRRVAIDTWRENVAYLYHDCAEAPDRVNAY